MTRCPHNPGVDAITCKECVPYCGFNPKETARRKKLISKGKGLTANAYGLRRLKIKRRK